LSGVSWDHERYCEELDAEITRFATAVRGADPATAVRTCPGWTLADLARHVGMVHRWAAQMVRERATERLAREDMNVDVPERAADYADWVAAGAGPVLSAFRAADPAAPMWAWGADKHARFWPRRMLHETTVHRADAELALEREPRVDAATAVDGVDELLENLPHAAYFRPRVSELRGDGESLHLHCTDVDGEWTVYLHPDTFTWDHGHTKATTAVRGPASDLLLLLYGRRRPDDSRFERFGSDALLGRWLERSAL
jgi:uncharacterized protein (TIGR03083 family)